MNVLPQFRMCRACGAHFERPRLSGSGDLSSRKTCSRECQTAFNNNMSVKARAEISRQRISAPFLMDGEMVCTITFSKGEKGLISACDADLAGRRIWTISNKGYPHIQFWNGEGRRVRATLSRLIMGFPEGFFIDHINACITDNRRSNLRVVTPSQNQQARIGNISTNTSGFRGVSFKKKRQHFEAYVTSGGRYYSLGCFATAEEANATAIAGRKKYMTHAPECDFIR